MNHLLHPGNFERIPVTGHLVAQRVQARADEVALATADLIDEPVSIVVRSRNNVSQLESLFDDITSQVFNGEVELVVVDTESTDGTPQAARKFGATVVAISQDGFSYPKSLNKGFAAASHDWILSLVDHSALSNTHVLRTLTRWRNEPNVAAAWGLTLPNANASRTELIGAAIARPKQLAKPAHLATEKDTGPGFMGANCVVISRAAWDEVGGFDETFGAGGEDGALGKSIMAAGYNVAFEPALSVHHTHGLGPVNSLRQELNWRRMGEPRDFDTRQLSYRTDIPE